MSSPHFRCIFSSKALDVSAFSETAFNSECDCTALLSSNGRTLKDKVRKKANSVLSNFLFFVYITVLFATSTIRKSRNLSDNFTSFYFNLIFHDGSSNLWFSQFQRLLFVLVLDVLVGAGRNQDLGDLDVAVLASQMQGGVPVAVLDVEVHVVGTVQEVLDKPEMKNQATETITNHLSLILLNVASSSMERSCTMGILEIDVSSLVKEDFHDRLVIFGTGIQKWGSLLICASVDVGTGAKEQPHDGLVASRGRYDQWRPPTVIPWFRLTIPLD